MTEQIIEDLKFSFLVESIKTESDSNNKEWLNIGGIALTEGVSRNNNNYKFSNLKENDGKEFKWIVGHPEEAEEHVVGKGILKLENKQLMHLGKIRNTIRHPDIVESVKDGFLGPSIHACAKKARRDKEGMISVEGLEIEGVGLVAFQGVKNASIDYAIAESFNKKLAEMDDLSSKSEELKTEVASMPEDEIEKKEVEAEVEEKPELKSEEPEAKEKPELIDGKFLPKEESAELKALKEELNAMKLAKKSGLVESIVKINPKFKAEDLLKESEEKLNLIKEYEEKLSKNVVGNNAILEAESNDTFILSESNEGVTMSKALHEQFNKELRDRIRGE